MAFILEDLEQEDDIQQQPIQQEPVQEGFTLEGDLNQEPVEEPAEEPAEEPVEEKELNRFSKYLRKSYQEETGLFKKEKGPLDYIKKPKEKSEDGKRSWFSDVALQMSKGALKALTYPADLFKAAASGMALDILKEEKSNAIQEGRDFDIDAAWEVAQEGLDKIPTQDFLEGYLEDVLEEDFGPQSESAKYLGKAAEIASFVPGETVAKTLAGAGAGAAVNLASDKLGLPEPVGEIAGMVTSGGTQLIKTPTKLSPKTAKIKTPKALTKKLIGEEVGVTSRQTQEKAIQALQSFDEGVVKDTKLRPEKPVKASKKLSDIEAKAFTKEKELTKAEKLAESISKKEESIADAARKEKLDVLKEHKDKISNLSPEAEVVHNNVSDSVSKESFKSNTEAGKSIQKAVKEAKDVEHKQINKLYKIAEKDTSKHAGKADNLVTYIEKKVDQLDQTLHKSPGEKKVLNTYNDILFNLRDKGGNARNVKVSELIKTSDSVASEINYINYEPDAKDILKGLPTRINEEARRIVVSRGGSTKSIDIADKAYGEWSNKYINKDMKPYLQIREVNPEELFAGIHKEEVYRSIYQALPEGKVKAELLTKSAKEIIPNRLNPFIKDIEKVGGKAYEREIENLKGFLPEELVNKADTAMKAEKLGYNKLKNAEAFRKNEVKLLKSNEVTEKATKKAIELEKEQAKLAKEELRAKKSKEGEKPRSIIRRSQENAKTKTPKETEYTKKVKSIAKWSKETPETLAKKMDSVSGINEIEASLLKKKGGDKIYNSLKKSKIRDIVQPKIGEKLTGESVSKTLANRKNYDLLEKLIGKEELDSIIEVANIIGKKEIRRNSAIKLGKRTLTLVGGYAAVNKLRRYLFGGSTRNNYAVD